MNLSQVKLNEKTYIEMRTCLISNPSLLVVVAVVVMAVLVLRVKFVSDISVAEVRFSPVLDHFWRMQNRTFGSVQVSGRT